MSAKFDIEKFDGKISFSIWRVQMRVVLTHSGLKKALDEIENKSASMIDEHWEELDKKVLSSIQLSLSKEVLREVANESTIAELWLKLESLYMTKSLANKLRLKERFYTIRMVQGTPIQSNLNEFNSILLDPKNIDIKINDEDKVVLLVVSLPSTYKHFKEIMLYGNDDTLSFEDMLYGNNDTLSFEDVKSNLLSKEKFDLEVHSVDRGEGLNVRGRTQEKRSTSDKKFRSMSRGRKSNKFCGYCKKPGYEISDCFILKKKQEKQEKGKATQSPEATNIEADSDSDITLFVVSSNKRSKTE